MFLRLGACFYHRCDGDGFLTRRCRAWRSGCSSSDHNCFTIARHQVMSQKNPIWTCTAQALGHVLRLGAFFLPSLRRRRFFDKALQNLPKRMFQQRSQLLYDSQTPGDEPKESNLDLHSTSAWPCFEAGCIFLPSLRRRRFFDKALQNLPKRMFQQRSQLLYDSQTPGDEPKESNLDLHSTSAWPCFEAGCIFLPSLRRRWFFDKALQNLPKRMFQQRSQLLYDSQTPGDEPKESNFGLPSRRK